MFDFRKPHECWLNVKKWRYPDGQTIIWHRHHASRKESDRDLKRSVPAGSKTLYRIHVIPKGKR
jgi:hypothetical protein